MKIKNLTFLTLWMMTVLMCFASPILAQTIEYDLTICGERVTNTNSNDVLGDGVFKYSETDNTLTINGDASYDGIVIFNDIPDLTINVTGNSTLTGNLVAIMTQGDMTICGNGILTLISANDCGLFVVDSKVTVMDMSLDVKGKWGIAGYPNNEHLVIYNSEVHAVGSDGAICDFTSISIEGCDIAQPEGGYVNGGVIVEAAGNSATEVTIAKPIDILIGYEYDGAYWSTYYNSNVTRVADANTVVYTATLSPDKSLVTLNQVQDRIIKKGQAVILKSSSESILLTKTSETGSGNFEDNCLSGFDWPTDVPADQGTIYTMNVEHSTLGFYRFTGNKLNAHKAFLAINKSSDAPTRIIFDMGETTGIQDVELRNDNGFDGYFTIDGRHFNGSPTAPGIYIVNGRKIIIKTGRTLR